MNLEDLKVLQNASHLVRSPLKVFGTSLSNFTLQGASLTVGTSSSVKSRVLLPVGVSVVVAVVVSVVSGVYKLRRVAVGTDDLDAISWSTLIIDCCNRSENTSAYSISSSTASSFTSTSISLSNKENWKSTILWD